MVYDCPRCGIHDIRVACSCDKSGWTKLDDKKEELLQLQMARYARSRAAEIRNSVDISLPSQLLIIRQKHKEFVAEMFERLAARLDRAEENDNPLNWFLIVDLLVYEPGFSPITALGPLEDKLIRLI